MESRIVYFTTDSRENASTDITNGKFSVELASPIKGYNRCKVMNIHFPNGMYNIRSGYNDKLYWRDATTGATITSTLTNGNYDITGLITEINTQLAADKTDANTYTVAQTTNYSGILKFTASAGTIALYTGPDSVLPTIGFGVAAHAAAATLTAPYCYDLSMPTLVLATNIDIDSIQYGTLNIENAFLINLSEFGTVSSMMTTSNDETYEIFHTDRSYEKLEFRLMDHRGVAVNNNGIRFGMTIKFFNE